MRMFVSGTMNGLGAGWMCMGITKPSTVLLVIGVAVYFGQWLVQIWPARSLTQDTNGARQDG